MDDGRADTLIDGAPPMTAYGGGSRTPYNGYPGPGGPAPYGQQQGQGYPPPPQAAYGMPPPQPGYGGGGGGNNGMRPPPAGGINPERA